MVWIVIWALFSFCYSASYSPLWQTSSYFQCSSITLFSANTTTTSTNYTFTSFTPLDNGNRPSAFLGVLNWQLAQGDSKQLAFNVTHTSVSTTTFRIRTQLGNNTSISSLIVGILLLDDANFSSINVNRLATVPTFTNISTGTGNRYDISYVAFSNSPIDLTHAIYMIPCLTLVNINSNGSSYYALKITLQISNNTHYYYNFSTTGNNAVTTASFYRIIYDQTQIQQTKFNYLDVRFFVADNNAITQNVTFVYSNTNNFVAGINAFNYSSTQIWQFNFSTQAFIYTSKYNYNNINITCWNYRYRECPTGYLYYLESQNLCYDVCPSNYYTNYDSNYCQLCHTSCLTCNDSTISSCLTCDSTRTLNSSKYCICKSGYVQINSTCVMCAAPCITCSSQTTCLTCNTTGNMVLSGTTCVCVTGGMLVLPAKTSCNLCSTISPGCIGCSTTACTVCDTVNNFYRSGSVCLCVSNYYLNSSNQCQECPSLPNCLICTNATYCSSCGAGYQPVNGVCKCKSIYKFLNSSNQCQDCVTPCQTCLNLSYCVTCVNKSQTLMNGICCSQIFYDSDTSKPCTKNICPAGYQNTTGICKEICGDGILFVLECDDGNLIDGDGCDSSCKIETNYTCVNGSSTTPSLCSYNQPLDLALVTSFKNISANTVVFEISVGPALKVLDTFDFSQIISTSIPNSDITFKYQNGVLTVVVDYHQTIQGENISLQLSPPTIYNNTFDMKLSASRFVIDPSNIPAYYFEETVYKESKILYTVLTVATALGIFLCVTFTRKMIGLELMSVLQMSFFSLTMTSNLHPIFIIWARNGFITNGYNILPNSLNQLFTQFTLPSNIQSIFYQPQYLQNLNWMFIAELAIFFLGLSMLLIGKFLFRFIFDAGVFMLKDILMTFVFFNTFNAAFSFGLQIYSMTLIKFGQTELVCDFVGIGVSLGFNCIVLYTYFKYTEIFNDQLIMLKLNRSSTIHPFVYCIYRFGIGFLIGLINSKSFCIFIILALEISYLTYISINHPHKFNYQFVRGILNQSSIIFHLITLILYQYILTDSYTSNHNIATAVAWLDVIIILGAVVFSGYCFMYSLLTEQSMDNKIANINEQTNENLRTKDMIHDEDVKSGAESEPYSYNENNKVVIQQSTESKRKIMDPDEDQASDKKYYTTEEDNN